MEERNALLKESLVSTTRLLALEEYDCVELVGNEWRAAKLRLGTARKMEQYAKDLLVTEKRLRLTE